MVKAVIFLRLAVFLLSLALPWPGQALAGPYGIALVGDPHLPGKYPAIKRGVLRTISSWDDIDLAVVLGDICKGTGTAEEYAAAGRLLRQLRKPARLLVGNHDYLYADEPNEQGRKILASPEERREKLALFGRTFGLESLYGSEIAAGYHLVYLATDHLSSPRLAELSGGQLAWLRQRLALYKSLPTLIFFHAPLAGTVHPYNERVNTPGFVAQPAEAIRDLLAANPQVFLWASGHIHLPATNKSYSDPVNLFAGRVTVIHNADLERKRPWTNCLYLHPDEVVVRTYDHFQKAWLPQFERRIRPPLPPRP